MRHEYFRKLGQATVLAGVFIYPAAAQQIADNSSSAGLEEVTVTAQKKSESLQTTPIAITALTSAALDNRGITNTMDLEGSIPNFQVEALTANLSSINVSMRGASDQQGALETDESPVGLYIDGVYHSRLAGANFEFTDIERIEVLRGPQGTLYGRNTVAGAINIITRKPKDEYWGDLEIGGGSFGTIEAKGSVGGPVIENMLGASAAFVSMNTDGYQYNRALNYGVGHQHDVAGHANFHLFGIDNFDATLSLTMVSNKDDGYSPTPVTTNGGATEDLGKETYSAGGPDVTQSPVPGYGNNQQWSASLNMSYDFGPMQLRSITGYTDLYDRYAGDFGGGTAVSPGVYIPNFYRDGQAHDEQFSQELQLTGSALDSALTYIGGLYYFHETGTQQLKDQFPFSPTFIYHVAPTDFNLTTDGFAGYAQGTYHFTDAFSVTAGARYSTDQKRQNASISNGFGIPPVIAYANQNKGFHTITPKLEVDYQITPDHFAYASVGEGFQSGGYSGLAVGDPSILRSHYNDETVWSYETGLKSTFFDHRLRVNTAFFYALYYGLQETAIVTPPLSIAQQNVGDASVYGLELEMTAAITSELTASLNLGLMHDEYTALSPTSTAYQNNAAELPETPNYTGQLALDYKHALDTDGHNHLIVGGSVSTRGGERTDAGATTRADALTTVQAYVGTRLFDDQWEVRLDVKNLTDTRKLTCCSITSAAGIVTPPRMFLASARYHY